MYIFKKASYATWTLVILLSLAALFDFTNGGSYERLNDLDNGEEERNNNKLSEKESSPRRFSLLHSLLAQMKTYQQQQKQQHTMNRQYQKPDNRAAQITDKKRAVKRGVVANCISQCVRRKTLSFLGCKAMCH